MSSTTNAIEATRHTLTRHPSGSPAELWTISFPLMLSSFSGTLMMFLDRLVLAQYSLEAMNAAAGAVLTFAIFQYSVVSICNIAEVFVGQYYGSKQYREIAKPVWQMIWFSLFLIIPFWAGFFLEPNWLVPKELTEHGMPYIKYLMLFGPFFALNGALSAFYVGQGKVKLVSISVFLGAVINLVLDIILVFGIKDYVPALGAQGAAIATGLAQMLSFVLLFGVFISKNNHERYNTRIMMWDWAMMKKCLKIGLPSAIGRAIEISAWAIVARMISHIGPLHMSAFAIAQSIWILFSFIPEGSAKAVTVITANFLGAKQSHHIKPMVVAGVKIQFIAAAILSIPLLVFPELVLSCFLGHAESNIEVSHLYAMAKTICFFTWVAVLFDGIAWLFCGILTASGDTRYIMLVEIMGSWLFGILPVYFIVLKGQGSPEQSVMLITLYVVMIAICFYSRYRTQPWLKTNLIGN